MSDEFKEEQEMDLDDATDQLFQQFIESELPPRARISEEEASVREDDVYSEEEEFEGEQESAEEPEESTEDAESEQRVDVEKPPVPPVVAPQNDTEIKALREALAYTQQQLQAFQAEKAQQKQNVPNVAPIEFVKTEEEYSDILTDRNKLNQLLNQVYTSGFARARETVLQEIPSVVTPAIRQEITKTTLLEGWRRNNPDLLDKMDYVTMVAQQLAAQHQSDPSWDWPNLFEELGPAVRQRLGVAKPSAEAAKQKKPAFANAKQATRKPSPKEISDAEKQLAWLFSDNEE